MRVITASVILAACAGLSAQTEHPLAKLGTVDVGFVALCKQSAVDELQVIGESKKLTTAEASKLGRIFSAEETWFETGTDGRRLGRHIFGFYYWSFKFVLGHSSQNEVTGPVAMIRLALSGAVSVTVDGVPVECPAMRSPALKELSAVLEEWFPGYHEIALSNEGEWVRKISPGLYRPLKEPNKSPEPTPTAVTPRAIEGKSK